MWGAIASSCLLITKRCNSVNFSKYENIGFVRRHIYWNFYEDDIIIVTSRVHRTQSASAVFCPFFYHLPRVKHHCKLWVPKNNTFSNETYLNVKHQRLFINILSKFFKTLILSINKFLNAFCKNDSGCCPSHWCIADFNFICDANVCPPSIVIGPKRW